MSLLFSSHLLPDVEGVCDYVVVLGAGKVLKAGNIQELKQVHAQRFEVRLKADPASFIQRLAAMGCSTEPRDDLLLVELPAGRTTHALGSRRGRAAANPSSPPAAQHARRSLLASGGASIMPIFDQGYQHWSGHLSGHAWRWLAITRHGVRIGLKNKALRRVLFVAWLPAVALAAMLCMWGLMERNSESGEAVLSNR